MTETCDIGISINRHAILGPPMKGPCTETDSAFGAARRSSGSVTRAAVHRTKGHWFVMMLACS